MTAQNAKRLAAALAALRSVIVELSSIADECEKDGEKFNASFFEGLLRVRPTMQESCKATLGRLDSMIDDLAIPHQQELRKWLEAQLARVPR